MTVYSAPLLVLALLLATVAGVLIVVGVAMDLVQQVESQLVMRNYEGFMKRGRIRGRR